MGSFIHGIGDEVVVTLFSVMVTFLLCLFLYATVNWRLVRRWFIDYFINRAFMWPFRTMLRPLVSLYHAYSPHHREGNVHLMPALAYNRELCPICLCPHRFAVETNCGHLYCGSCLQHYVNTVRRTRTVRCAMCRQEVNLLLQYFTDAEMNVEPDSQMHRELIEARRLIDDYNQRTIGYNRSLFEILRDSPILLRHLWNHFLSDQGLLLVFRIRIFICIVAGLVYLFVPIDMIPEAVFGVIGYMDDCFIIFILAVYCSNMYRHLLINGGE